MLSSPYKCPHCGKKLPSPDKLGWHLSRECPAWAARVPPGDPASDSNKAGPDDDRR